jgi:hypothetical protein
MQQRQLLGIASRAESTQADTLAPTDRLTRAHKDAA